MSEDELITSYCQLKYALDFDAARSNNDGSKKIYLPL